MIKRLLMAAACSTALSAPALAQQSNAVAVGTGIAKSRSDSTAVAVSGQGGAGGTGVGNVTLNTATPGVTQQIVTTQGKTSVSTVPSVFAPGLAAAGIESCLGSASGGGSWLGTGITLGGSIPDGSCNARLDARTLWSMGLRKAAVARLCLSADIWRSMPDVCAQYVPQPAGYGVVAAPVAYAPSPYAGGDIWLTEGSTGLNRLCHDYDATGQRCRVWAHRERHAATKKGLVHGDAIKPVAALEKDQTK